MRFVMNWTSPEDQGGAYNPDRRRRSSVVEQPPCKRQVVCSIQTGGTNVHTQYRKRHDAPDEAPERPGWPALRPRVAAGGAGGRALPGGNESLWVGRNCAIYVLSASAGGVSLVPNNRPGPAGGGVPCSA